MSKKDWSTVELMAFNDMSPEQRAMEAEYAAEMEAGFQKYQTLVDAYRAVIVLEEDPDRRKRVEALLDWVHEDNV